MAYYHGRVKLDRFEAFELSSDMKSSSVSMSDAAKKGTKAVKDYGSGIAAQCGLVKKKTNDKSKTICSNNSGRLPDGINAKKKSISHEEKRTNFASSLLSPDTSSNFKRTWKDSESKTISSRDKSSCSDTRFKPTAKMRKSNEVADMEPSRQKYIKNSLGVKDYANALHSPKHSKQRRIKNSVQNDRYENSRESSDELLASSDSELEEQNEYNVKDKRVGNNIENRVQKRHQLGTEKFIKERGNSSVRANGINHSDKRPFTNTSPSKMSIEVAGERKKKGANSSFSGKVLSASGKPSGLPITNKQKKDMSRIYQKNQLHCSDRSENRKFASDSPGFIKSTFFEGDSAGNNESKLNELDSKCSALQHGNESNPKSSILSTSKADNFRIPKMNNDLLKGRKENEGSKKHKETKNSIMDVSKIKVESDVDMLEKIKMESVVNNVNRVKEKNVTTMKINLKNNKCIVRNGMVVRNCKGEDLSDWISYLNDQFKPRSTKSDTSVLSYFITLHSRFKVMETMEMNDLEVLPEEEANMATDDPIRIITSLHKDHYQQYLDESKLKCLPELLITRLHPSSIP